MDKLDIASIMKTVTVQKDGAYHHKTDHKYSNENKRFCSVG